MNEVWDSLDEETKYFAEHSTFVTYEGEDYQIVSDNFDDSDETDVVIFDMEGNVVWYGTYSDLEGYYQLG